MNTGDTVFEVDPITHLRLDTDTPSANTQTARLSAFTDSVPDDHAPEVLLAQEQRIDPPLILEQGPDPIGGVVTMDDGTFTTLLSLHSSGVSTTPRFNCRALLDTGSPQSFIHEGAFDQMVTSSVAGASCVQSTTPTTWSGCGSRQLLSTHRQARMSVQFNHNGTPSASLAVWMYIVPNETMRCLLLLGRDIWMRFHSHSYQMLSPQPDGRVFGELTLSLGDDNLGSAAPYIRNHEISDAAYHLVLDGLGVSLTDFPQLILVNLVRLDGSPALTGHYMVNLLPIHDDSNPSERFVSSGRQSIPLTGYQELEPGNVLDTASSPLLRVPLEAPTLHDVPADVSALAESPTTPASPTALPHSTTPDPPDEPHPELLHRLDRSQRESFLRLWNTVPPHIRRIDFTLDATGWDPTALDALSTTLTTYADVFSSSKLGYGECSLRPFEIKVPPGTQPTQSRPYRLNPVLSKQANAILDSYLAAGFIRHSTSPWSSPLVCVPKKSGGIRITVNYQKLDEVTKVPQIAIPRIDEVLDTLGGGSVFSVFDLFSGFTQLTIHPDTIPLTAFCAPNELYEWLGMPQGAAGAPAWFISARLVTAGLDNIRIYFDDAIDLDDCPIHHVATLATFFARLRLHKLKLSPDKSRIGAARVDFLGHVIAADGVRPNDDRVAALTRMPMPKDIKKLCSLLGLPHPPDNVPSKKGRCVRFHPHNGGYRSCPSRGTRSITGTRLPELGRGHRHVAALPPPLRRQHRWSRNHPRTRTAGWLNPPPRLHQPSHPRL